MRVKQEKKPRGLRSWREEDRQRKRERWLVGGGPWRALVLWTWRVSEASALGSLFKAKKKTLNQSFTACPTRLTHMGQQRGHARSNNYKEADNTRRFVVDLWQRKFLLLMHDVLEIGESASWCRNRACVCACMCARMHTSVHWRVCASAWPMLCFFNELGLHTSLIGWHKKDHPRSAHT